MTISHTSDIKDKNIKMINAKNRYNIRKRVKKIKSINKNNITFNESNTISSINKNKRKLKMMIKSNYQKKIALIYQIVIIKKEKIEVINII